MARRCSATAARRLVNSYISEIERKMHKIQKNFEDMDFENANARDEMEYIVNNMKASCRSLIAELRSYRFL